MKTKPGEVYVCNNSIHFSKLLPAVLLLIYQAQECSMNWNNKNNINILTLLRQPQLHPLVAPLWSPPVRFAWSDVLELEGVD